MTHLPPESRGSAADRDAVDWHALLAGDPAAANGSDAAANAAATSSNPASGGPTGQPMTRREAREAEQRRSAVVATEEVAPAKPSRAERRAAVSEYDHHDPEKPKRRGPWGCLIGLVVVAALVAGAFFFLQGPITSIIERFTPAADYTGTGTGEVVFMIHEGDTGSDISQNLVDEGVTAS